MDDNAGSSKWSLWSHNSLLSICSSGSMLSIGSVGSFASVGSIASAGSVLSIGSWASAGSVMADRSRWSLLSSESYGGWLGEREQNRGRLAAPLVVAAIGAAASAGWLWDRRRSPSGR